MREQTLKSVLVFVPKLSERTINGELLRHLAKTANDEQPGIRTNTTICLGKIAKNMGNSSRAKVLIAAFSRSLRDPFVHARNAALLALAATVEYFTPEDIAARILPAICTVLLDKEKVIRDQSLKTMDVFMQKIRKAATALPDTALPPAGTPGDANGAARMSTPQPDQGTSAAGWAGWAISSFTNHLSAAAGEIESASVPTPAPSGTPMPLAAPTVNNKPSMNRPSMHGTSSASTLHRQAMQSPSASRPMSPASSASNAAGDSFFADAADDNVDDGADDAWGAMDDGFGGDGGDAWDETGENGENPQEKKPSAPASRAVSGSGGVKPFGDDDAEPDFAGWLAAQESKKKSVGGGKALPKGLSKAGGGTLAAAKRPTVVSRASTASKPKAAPKPAKKIDLAPKDSGDDDAWGDGW